MNENTQKSPFLPLQRNFLHKNTNDLTVVLDKSYVEIASRVNERSIGIYAPGNAITTGDKYYMQGQPESSQRCLYMVSSAPTTIPHNIDMQNINVITKMYGQYTDGTSWYGLIADDNKGITNQITFSLDQTNINVLSTGTPNPLIRGIIVIEWTANQT
jgi:hypothetical protein